MRAFRYLLGVTVPIVLVATGITLLFFGALILLKFPDKPGGTIEAKAFGQGFHISSIGAGLPIIVIGALLLIAAAFVPHKGWGRLVPCCAATVTYWAG